MSPLPTTLTDATSRLWMREVGRRLVRGRQVRELTRWEDAEVERLHGELRPLPRAQVAVVIPTYGRERLVGEAVRSALAQTVTDIVVVVVSDGPEPPGDLPQDPRVVTIALSRHVGVVGVVRNVGIRATSSTWIAFLDDDNTWHPDHLETLLPRLEAGADLAYSAVNRVLEDGRRLDELYEPFDRDELRDRNYIDINSLVVRRELGVHFSRLPRRSGQAPGEDWELLWRLSRRGRVVGVPHATVRYLINPESYFWRGFSEHADEEISRRPEHPDAADRG